MSTPLKKAQEIRKNAQDILQEKEIERRLKRIGELYFTGSYTLDLMTWNDIDMQIVLHERQHPIDVLGRFFTEISKDPDFIEAQIINFTGDYKPKMPRGVYLGLKLNCPKHGGLWKLDLWSLAQKDFEKNRLLLENLRARLTPELRKLLIEIKAEIMAGKERMPQMSSHLLYQAVLLEEITDRGSLKKYFEKNNLNLDV